MTWRRVRDHSALKWLYPGMHIKRWLLLLLVGVALMGLGIAYLLREAYLQAPLPGIFYYLTLQFIPRWMRGLLFIGASVGTVGLAVYKLNQSLLYAFVRPDWRDKNLAEAIYAKRFLSRGPKIVAIGGGTGLSTLLRGLKNYTSNLTAIVTVADDIEESHNVVSVRIKDAVVWEKAKLVVIGPLRSELVDFASVWIRTAAGEEGLAAQRLAEALDGGTAANEEIAQAATLLREAP
ncbi:MAG: hypothetical protein C4321_03955, partial [Chloroflexota bacterium]